LFFAIPPKSFPIVRRGGIFANTSREKLETAKYYIAKDWTKEYRFVPEPKDMINRKLCSHRTRQIELTGVDPYLCPCGKIMKRAIDLVIYHPIWKFYNIDDIKKLSYSELNKLIIQVTLNNSS
jgi:hypothetical protein